MSTALIIKWLTGASEIPIAIALMATNPVRSEQACKLKVTVIKSAFQNKKNVPSILIATFQPPPRQIPGTKKPVIPED